MVLHILVLAVPIGGVVLMNAVGFVVSALAQTDLIYDLVGASSTIGAAGFALILCPSQTGRVFTAGCMVMAWATRLGLHLFTRILAAGRDKRFDTMKKQPARFAVAWTLQTLWVLINVSPLLALAWNAEMSMDDGSGTKSGRDDTALRYAVPVLGTAAWDTVTFAVWVVGMLIETVADAQKRAHHNDLDRSSTFISTGLWRYSRHPNYFGEMVLWLAFVAYCAPDVSWSGGQWLVLLSPAFVIFLLLKVSGIPLLEAAAKKRWGETAAYREYVARTNVLIPWLPASLGAARR